LYQNRILVYQGDHLEVNVILILFNLCTSLNNNLNVPNFFIYLIRSINQEFIPFKFLANVCKAQITSLKALPLFEDNHYVFHDIQENTSFISFSKNKFLCGYNIH
jgi:hypothetical protein